MDTNERLTRIEQQLDQILNLFRAQTCTEKVSDSQWLTIREASQISRLSTFTLRLACSRHRFGRDSYKTTDGSWRIRRSMVEWVRDNGLPESEPTVGTL